MQRKQAVQRMDIQVIHIVQSAELRLRQERQFRPADTVTQRNIQQMEQATGMNARYAMTRRMLQSIALKQ